MLTYPDHGIVSLDEMAPAMFEAIDAVWGQIMYVSGLGWGLTVMIAAVVGYAIWRLFSKGL